MRKLVLLLATFFSLACGLASPSLADDKADATAFANDLGHKALAIITDQSQAKDTKRASLETLFQENVDIDWIGKFVLGRFWRSATPEQQQQYLANYKTFLIKHYTSNLADFTDANFEVTKVMPADNGGNVVVMHLKRPKAEDTIVNYTIRAKEDGKLAVYDIAVEGVSMITTQRSEFNSVASSKGIDFLIAELGRRSQQEEEAK